MGADADIVAAAAQAHALLVRAREEVAAALTALDALLPDLEWRASAAERFHLRAGELRAEAVRLDVRLASAARGVAGQSAYALFPVDGSG
ncbi:hypothetical protein [Microbacterium album]|nr:hypothetical protein [Microbacterium album]